MNRDQLQRLVDGALCVIDKCDEDECAKFATWQAWDFGNVAGGQPWCDEHCPPCTEQRDGYCKEAADGWRLAQELNDLMAAGPSAGAANHSAVPNSCKFADHWYLTSRPCSEPRPALTLVAGGSAQRQPPAGGEK